jgi:hypothetical protein
MTRVGGMHLSTFAWPGPGNSEAPDDPEGGISAAKNDEPNVLHALSETALLATFPWPGPGDSEG